ncbi:hypothetical protein B296_00058216, partial [Ensete ventricosum]
LPNAAAREQKNWLACEMENIYQPRPPLAASLFEATGGEGAGVMLSRDPKPRLRWTPDLHDRFVDAVTKLGGPDRSNSSKTNCSSTTSSDVSTTDSVGEMPLGEALRYQIEVQRKLQEQLEVSLMVQCKRSLQSL